MLSIIPAKRSFLILSKLNTRQNCTRLAACFMAFISHIDHVLCLSQRWPEWSHFFRLRLRSCSKLFEPDPEIFQIWKPDSCSDSGYHRSNWQFSQIFTYEITNTLLSKLKSDSTSGSGFSQIFPGTKETLRILPESNPALRIHGHLWSEHLSVLNHRFINIRLRSLKRNQMVVFSVQGEEAVLLRTCSMASHLLYSTSVSVLAHVATDYCKVELELSSS